MAIRSVVFLLSLSAVSSWINAPLSRRVTELKAVVTLDGEVIRGEIAPVGNYVLVKTKDTLTATEGGILLPDQAKERPTEGVVVAAGPGRLHPHTGVRIQNPVKPGDSVLYGKFDGSPIEYNDDQCQVIRDDDIMVSYQGLTMTLENCQPIRDYVLIQLEEPALETLSGIVVAAQVTKEDVPCEGRVLKVGEGRMASDGKLTKVPFKVGDYVKFKDYGGNDVVIEGKPFSLVRMVDILATLNEE